LSTATGGSLLADERFRGLLVWSMGGHVAAAIVALAAPHFRPAPAPTAIFIDLVAAPAAPVAAPTPPRQVVDEPVVIREPKPKPKRKAKVPPKVKPKVKKKVAKKPAPPTPEQLLAQMRQNVAERPGTSDPIAEIRARAGTTGQLSPELAAFQRKVERCMYANWVGVRSYRNRSDLEVHFRVSLDAGGRLRGVSKTRASGEEVVDDSAERALWKCQPFPSPPLGYRDFDFAFNPAEKM